MTSPPTDLTWPPKLRVLANGSVTLEEIDQGSPAEIDQAYALIATLRRGDLPWASDVGIPDPLGEGDPDVIAAAMTSALAKHDGRLIGATVSLSGDRTDRSIHLHVNPDSQ